MESNPCVPILVMDETTAPVIVAAAVQVVEVAGTVEISLEWVARKVDSSGYSLLESREVFLE